MKESYQHTYKCFKIFPTEINLIFPSTYIALSLLCVRVISSELCTEQRLTATEMEG
jgi:hypothetical protein